MVGDGPRATTCTTTQVSNCGIETPARRLHDRVHFSLSLSLSLLLHPCFPYYIFNLTIVAGQFNENELHYCLSIGFLVGGPLRGSTSMADIWAISIFLYGSGNSKVILLLTFKLFWVQEINWESSICIEYKKRNKEFWIFWIVKKNIVKKIFLYYIFFLLYINRFSLHRSRG